MTQRLYPRDLRVGDRVRRDWSCRPFTVAALDRDVFGNWTITTSDGGAIAASVSDDFWTEENHAPRDLDEAAAQRVWAARRDAGEIDPRLLVLLDRAAELGASWRTRAWSGAHADRGGPAIEMLAVEVSVPSAAYNTVVCRVAVPTPDRHLDTLAAALDSLARNT